MKPEAVLVAVGALRLALSATATPLHRNVKHRRSLPVLLLHELTSLCCEFMLLRDTVDCPRQVCKVLHRVNVPYTLLGRMRMRFRRPMSLCVQTCHRLL